MPPRRSSKRRLRAGDHVSIATAVLEPDESMRMHKYSDPRVQGISAPRVHGIVLGKGSQRKWLVNFEAAGAPREFARVELRFEASFDAGLERPDDAGLEGPDTTIPLGLEWKGLIASTQVRGELVHVLQRNPRELERLAALASCTDRSADDLKRGFHVLFRPPCLVPAVPVVSVARLHTWHAPASPSPQSDDLQPSEAGGQPITVALLHGPTASSMGIDTSKPQPWLHETTTASLSNHRIAEAHLGAISDGFEDGWPWLSSDDRALLTTCARISDLCEDESIQGALLSLRWNAGRRQCSQLEQMWHRSLRMVQPELPFDNELMDGASALTHILAIAGCLSPHKYYGEKLASNLETALAYMRSAQYRPVLVGEMEAAVVSWPESWKRVALDTIRWLFGDDQLDCGFPAYQEHVRLLHEASAAANFER